MQVQGKEVQVEVVYNRQIQPQLIYTKRDIVKTLRGVSFPSGYNEGLYVGPGKDLKVPSTYTSMGKTMMIDFF